MYNFVFVSPIHPIMYAFYLFVYLYLCIYLFYLGLTDMKAEQEKLITFQCVAAII